MIAQLLHNPLLLKLVGISLLLMGAFVIAMLVISRLRKQLVSTARNNDGNRTSGDSSMFKLAAYEGVIRRLKDQERELEKLRKSEREQANESASMSEAVLSNLASGVVLFNPANLVRQANPAAKSLLGYATVSGLHARDIFRGVSGVRLPLSGAMSDAADAGIDWSEAGATPLLLAIDLCIRQSKLFRRIEADYSTPSGEPRVLGITMSPIRGAGGETMGAAALLSDLTEITRMSQQMQLRESMAALGEMSAGIAHEFKNSLATISGYAQMLRKDSVLEPAYDFAGKIAKETASLARIVNDFLQFAKPQGVQREPLDLRAMLNDCANEVNAEIDLEDFPPGLQIYGEPTALRQAFSNLLRNSVEAGRQGTPLKVTAQATLKDEGTTLVISDNGQGIPPDQMSKIFIPFYTTKSEGTGLGLALVHRIVTEHGGTIQVSSSEVGTAFTITLPHNFSAANS